MLIKAEQGKILKEQVRVLDEKIVLLEAKVSLLEEKDDSTVSSYERELKLLNDQKAIYEDQINTYETLLRKERRKRRWTAVGGIFTTGAAILLSIKK